jgi:hypothetical protein
VVLAGYPGGASTPAPTRGLADNGQHEGPADGSAAMKAAWYLWRRAGGSSWRTVVVVALVGGLLGAVALGAVAGARRTGSAYGRYLRSVRASDVFVNVPVPDLPLIRQVENLPGAAGRPAAWVGINGEPVVHGHVDPAFLTDSIVGSLDGEYFRQDVMSVQAGRLPVRAGELALTAQQAQFFGVGVGGHVQYQFYRTSDDGADQPDGRRSFLVTGIVVVPPALVDQFDAFPTAVLPPAATARFLDGRFIFGWVGSRLARGPAGIPALRRSLAALAQSYARAHRLPLAEVPPPGIRRMDVIQHHAQQAIAPQALALGAFGVLAALAMLVLTSQGMSYLLSRAGPPSRILQAHGATRAQAALAIAGPPGVAAAAAAALAVAGAVALSPLAPVGEVRRYDPAHGLHADAAVLAGGGVLLLGALLVIAAVLSWRVVRRAGPAAGARQLAITSAAARAGLPVTAVIAARYALEPGPRRPPAPVRATLGGSMVAAAAVAAALVFGTSLHGLVTHPARYGWNWDVLLQSSGGYVGWSPARMSRLVDGQPGVTAWSVLGFSQENIDGQEVPVAGIQPQLGSLGPPTSSGRPLSGANQIELGVATLRQLGKHIGDTVQAGTGTAARMLVITGTVTLPSLGVMLEDHPSLGVGALMPERTLLAIEGLPSGNESGAVTLGLAAEPTTAIFQVTSARAGTALASKIIAHSPDGTPGGTYRLGPMRGAAVIDAGQMGSQPLALALGLAIAAVLALALTVLASVRQRRPELALLKSLGLRPRQVRAIVAWQVTIILTIAAAAGVPLGVAAGRWAWTVFAGSIGVVPSPQVPVTLLAGGIAALLIAGNLLSAVPGAVAARITPAEALRSE